MTRPRGRRRGLGPDAGEPDLDAGVLDDPERLAALDPSDALGQAAGLGAPAPAGLRRREGGGRASRGRRPPRRRRVRHGRVGGRRRRPSRAVRRPRRRSRSWSSKGYALPEFAGPHTIVAALSFSGNTEETLAAYGEAVARGCRVVAVSAGGALAERAGGRRRRPRAAADRRPDAAHGGGRPDGVAHRRAGGGRASCRRAQEEVEEAAALLDDLAGRLGPDRPAAENPAKDLAAWIGARTPVVWGSEGLAEAPAGRFRTQVNENAKSPAFSAVLSELDHNEIEGWSAGRGRGVRGRRAPPRAGAPAGRRPARARRWRRSTARASTSGSCTPRGARRWTSSSRC